MALKATIYKANLSLSDMDRNLYCDHALTLARHPSETEERLMMRLLAYALCCLMDDLNGSLELAKGLADVNEPELWHKDLTGRVLHWIDLGAPDLDRIKRVAARCDQYTVLAYAHSASVWWQELVNDVVRLANVRVLQIPAAQSQALAELCQRGMQLSVMVQDGEVWVNTDTGSVQLVPTALKDWV